MTTRSQRIEYQLDEWVKGNLIHNKEDDECCPDFSCCQPDLLVDEQTRKIFKNGNKDQRETMLYIFLSNALAKHFADVNVHICNGKDEINKELN